MFIQHGWDSSDRSALRAFLESEVGKRFLEQLWAARPLPASQLSLELAALSGQRFEGYLDVILKIHELAYSQADVFPSTRRENETLPEEF